MCSHTLNLFAEQLGSLTFCQLVNSSSFTITWLWLLLGLRLMIRHIFNICEHIGSTTRLRLVFLGRVGPITVTFLFNLIEAKEILLGMTTDLAAGASTNVLFDVSPVFTIHLETLQKAPMFSVSPSTSSLFGDWRIIKRLRLLSEHKVVLFRHSRLGI